MLEDKDPNLTPISRLGEFGLIEHLTRGFTPRQPSVLKAVGDDAAVYAVSETEVHVLTTDMLIEGIHFDLRYVPLQHLGWKSVAVNLSDVYAMNAEPFGVTVSIALSSRFTVEAMEAFYEGVKVACEQFGVDLLGGDTSSSRMGLCISVTAVGKAGKDEVVYRSGAKENDLICVSGDLGGAYGGLQILEREKQVFLQNPDVQPDLSGFDYVVGRQLRPRPRKDIYEALREAGIRPSAMIDLSDGLASDLMHLSKASGTGAAVYEDRIPVDYQTGLVAEKLEMHPMTFALNGGEDYELLFTVPLEHHEALKGLKDVHIIGHVTEKAFGIRLINVMGQEFEMEAQGWNHFEEETGDDQDSGEEE